MVALGDKLSPTSTINLASEELPHRRRERRAG
jgi:hypothetical protein